MEPVAGAGFLIGERLLITCAHVIGQTPLDQVIVEFPAAGIGQFVGRIRPETWHPADTEDVVLIELDQAPPAPPLSLAPAAAARGRRARTYGFPEQAPSTGHYGRAVIGDFLPDPHGGLLQLSEANAVTVLFSGSPVIDEDTGLVRGMVTAITGADPYLRGSDIAYATPTETLLTIWPELSVHEEECPYQGLDPFTTERAQWFCGRREAVDRVLAGLRREHRFLLLLGPSGSGKTSLVQAAVLPALMDAAIPGSDRWQQRMLRPGQDASEVLGALSSVATLEKTASNGRMLLVIDQFEELFTEIAPEPAQQVLDLLTALAGSGAVVSLLLVMRDDFYPTLASRAPALMRVLEANCVNVPAVLTRDEIRDIVVGPAERANARLQPGLTERIVADACQGENALPAPIGASATVLPLLEFALTQLWQRRTDGQLTHVAYEKIGGVIGGLRDWCDDAYHSLSAERRQIARNLLTALVRDGDPAAGLPLTRRRRPLDELRQLADSEQSTTSRGQGSGPVTAVLGVFVQHRIVVTSQDPVSHQVSAELIHESVIGQWPRLREWVGQDRTFRDWLFRAENQQQHWDATGRDSESLLHGRDVDDGLDWHRQRSLPNPIVDYLRLSDQARQARLRRVRRVNRLLTALLVVAVTAAGTAWWQTQAAIDAQNQSNLRREESISRRIAGAAVNMRRGDEYKDVSALLSVEAIRAATTEQSLSAVLSAAADSKYADAPLTNESGGGVGFSPDGTMIAAATQSGVTVWQATTRKVVRTVDCKEGANDAAFTLDGRALVIASTACPDYGLTVQPLNSIRSTTYMPTVSGPREIKMSPDRRHLATVELLGNMVDVYDLKHPSFPVQLPGLGGEVGGIAFSHSGDLLAVAGDGILTIWRLGSPAPSRLAVLNSEGDTNYGVSFRPDADEIAVSSEKNVEVWSIRDINHPRRELVLRHDESVKDLEFTADGQKLAVASGASLVLWSTKNWERWATVTKGVSQYDFQLSIPFGGLLDGHILSLSPNGQEVAVNADQDVTWTLRPQDAVDKICRKVNRNLTRDEWARYLPDLQYHRTCK